LDMYIGKYSNLNMDFLLWVLTLSPPAPPAQLSLSNSKHPPFRSRFLRKLKYENRKFRLNCKNVAEA
jgi:hypothetical protein